MDKRYQIFVSSTYIDLIEERNEIMQALLELECMPAGMELFPAANESQWNWIKKIIDESDYYLVVVAGRYGTVSKETNQSYTEMEYRYALETGKPVIGFLHQDPSLLPAKKNEQSEKIAKKLESFRDVVKTKLCKFYSSPADLGAKVSRSITQLKKQYPATGWIRANILDEMASSDEFLKLKKENEKLIERIHFLGVERPKELDSLASGQELVEVDFSFERRIKNPKTNYYRKAGLCSETVEITWDEIFEILATDMIESANYWHPTQSLVKAIKIYSATDLDKEYPGDRYEDFKIYTNCYNTIMAQFRALKMITINQEKKWELTPFGDNYLASLVAVQKGEKRPKKDK